MKDALVEGWGPMFSESGLVKEDVAWFTKPFNKHPSAGPWR